jgi:predicted permease
VAPLFRDVLHRLRETPGVESAGIAETVPMGGEGESTGIRIPGQPKVDSKEVPFANFTVASPGYFESVGTPLLRGRDFQDTDSAESTPVAIINMMMAKKYWPGEDAIGKQVGPAGLRYPLSTIIGIVPDVKHSSLREETAPEMWVLYNQKPWPSMLNMRVAVRTAADPTGILPGLREAIRSIDPDLPLAKVATLTTLVDRSLTQPRFAMLTLCGFGALTLLLACIGLYGVIAYSVAQRTREIGIRMALGANRKAVFAMVLGEGTRVTLLGVGIGVVGAQGVTRLMAGMLYGVGASDPLTFAGVAVLLCAIGLMACYLPARRATRVDPMVALRHE